MPSTYLDLTNKLLRRLNEVELTQANFVSSRGVHATCRDAIADSVSAINAFCFEWPFNAYEHSQNLIPGVNEYGWPVGYKVADWNTFQIRDRDGRYKTLKKINRDQWYEKYRDLDYSSRPDGRGEPSFVFDSHGRGFGVTCAPDYSFPITFRYYIHPQRMVASSDTTTIPEEWDWVILQGALYHGSLFKESEGSADRAKADFEKSLASMRTLLVNKEEDMVSSQIIQRRRF